MVVNQLIFAGDICVFSPSISGLQRLLDICGDYAAEHAIAFNCNKTIGLLFCLQPVPSNVFLNGVRVQFFDQVKYLSALLNGSLKDDDDIQRQVKSQYCAANKFRETFDQCSPGVKTLYFVPIACQCMLANCGANTHRLVWSAYALHIIMLPNYSLHTQECKCSLTPSQPSCQDFWYLIEKCLYRFLQRCASSSNVFIRSLQISDALYNLHFSSII